MDFDRLKDMAGDPRFISGIHNYCDRWCERCEFTSRCISAAMQEEEEAERRDPAGHDVESEAFWDNLHGVFQQTIEMIREDAAEQGIDPEISEEEMAEYIEQEERKRRKAENHPASKAAWKYVKMTDKWFEENKALFEEEERQLNRAFLMQLPGEDPEEEAALVQDAIEVIGWYQVLIHVKFMRALHGADSEDILDDDGTPFPRDCDGSAKVSLLGIDRSIEAWGVLRRYLPAKSDSILSILVHLGRLRKRFEAAFPNARAFERPGFDGPIPPAVTTDNA
ncbi:MAG TPA: hypothetical protein VNE39_15010 [Planctomycetota bacterium]|nr:hypothetical protein [Planctomycetota bacterium]